MWYLIVTSRSLAWMLMSLLATLLIMWALVSPSWLVSSPQRIDYDNETITYNPSVGVFAKCGKPLKFDAHPCTTIAVKGLATDSHVFPAVWKATTIFLAIGLTIMSMTVCSSLMSCCIQSIFRKSIFTMSGAAQSLAGICFIIGVMLHPMGWGTSRVQKLCGRNASPFYPGDCSLGSGLYVAIVGTLMTFASACLSLPAELSTSSDKVQDQIYEGNTLICLT